MDLSLNEIAEIVSGKLAGDETIRISSLSNLEYATSTDLSFYTSSKHKKSLQNSNAGCVLIPLGNQDRRSKPTIEVADPYHAFIQMLTVFERSKALNQKGRQSPVYIAESAAIGEGGYIGAFAYIGERVRVGKDVRIFPQVYIGDDVEIGSGTILFPGVKIYSGSRIGSHCTVHAGAVIGSYGFGYLPEKNGAYTPIPQSGNVVLEDFVDIGANTTIDCATVNSTIIRAGTKIDNLVQIGHNVEIGENSILSAQVGVSGSTKIGKQVVLAGQVGIGGHLEIADGVQAGGKSGITNSVNKKNKKISGHYAFSHQENLKAYTLYKLLPSTMERIKALEEKLLNLNP